MHKTHLTEKKNAIFKKIQRVIERIENSAKYILGSVDNSA